VIEDAFRDGKLQVVICTSTLAVGVNLPAHLVIVKGVQMWTGASTGFRDYTDIEIQQMIGRAGRPQYDTSAKAVIMCGSEKVKEYEAMAHSRTVVESCLYESLVERKSFQTTS
jgi:ATP-dependent DNA helicase HFM1/MER3